MPCRSLTAPQSKQPQKKRQKVGQGDKSAFELARDARIAENGKKLAELGLGKETVKGKKDTVAIPQVQKIYCYTAQVRTSTCDHHHLTTTATR